MKNLLAILSLSVVLLTGCFEPMPLFTVVENKGSLIAEDHTTVQLHDDALRSLLASGDSIEFEVPYTYGTPLTLKLGRINLFAKDFATSWSQNENQYGHYFSGYVKGYSGSMVSISISPSSEITGLISIKGINDITIVKKQDNVYAVSNSLVSEPIDFKCGTVDVPVTGNMKSDTATTAKAASQCVTVDFELTYECFQYFKTVQAASNWLTSMFASVKLIYQREGIDISIQSIYVHQTDDGYSDATDQALEQFKNKRKNDPTFKGTFGHLVRGRNGGAMSGIAYVNTFCSGEYNFAVSEPMFTYTAYPAYSWSVNVLAHELGHNMGSPHTHSCNWVGGPIDNCYTQEGSCAAGPTPPAGGGTIMSYCHMKSGIGINMVNGFGKQPGDLIRSKIGMASCIACVVPPVITPPVDTVKPTGVLTLVTQGKSAVQSSSSFWPATNANNGNINDFNHTVRNSPNEWVRIDMGTSYKVSKVEIYNRKGCAQCVGRLKNFRVIVSDDSTMTWDHTGVVYDHNTVVTDGQLINISTNKSGRYLSVITNNNPVNFLHLAEVKGYTGGNVIVTPVCKDTVYKIIITRDSFYTGKVCR